MSSNSDKFEEIEKLVRQVQEGDKDAFTHLYDHFVDQLYRYIFYRVNSADAEDLLETVFLKVWENIQKYNAEKGNFSSWIFRIAHNLVVDYYRAAKERDTLELDANFVDLDREHNPVKKTEDVLNKDVLKIALNGLKEAYQELIVYKFINGLSNKEIADLLNKSEGSLRILQFRALKALKIELEKLGFKYDL